MILDQYYAQPKCSPSRAALMTGLYPYKMSLQRGAIGDFRPMGLPTVIKTLPEMLRGAGYSTHLVGKWHLGYCHLDYTPIRRGFDTFYGMMSQQSDHYTREQAVNKYMGSGYDHWRDSNVSHEGAGLYSTNLWEEETVRLVTSLNSSVPWFIELSLTAAHAPFQVPERFSDIYRAGRARPSGSKEEVTAWENGIVRRGMVTAIDESVGRIMEALRASDQHQNTLVVFSSDNGSGMKEGNNPLRGKKGEIFEGGVRVPAFVTGPPLMKSMKKMPSGYKRFTFILHPYI